MIHIALVGLPGAGKSTVGKALARQLGAPFVDLDQYIEAETGQRIPDLFAARGETGFRAVEGKSLRALTTAFATRDCVLATGGGVVVTEDCRQLLQNTWWTFFLRARVATLAGRLQQETDHRPLLQTEVPLLDRLTTLSAERTALYEQTARRTVAVDGRSVLEIVADILDERGLFLNKTESAPHGAVGGTTERAAH